MKDEQDLEIVMICENCMMTAIFLKGHLFTFTIAIHFIFKSFTSLQKDPMLWNKLAVIFYTSSK